MGREIVREAGGVLALPNVERARELLAKTHAGGEVRQIRAIAQAIATAERGRELGLDAAEIVAWADRRAGELAREIPKVPPDVKAGRGKVGPTPGQTSKGSRLSDLGLSRQRAAEYERIAALPEADQGRVHAAFRRAGQQVSSSALVALGRLDAPERRKAIAKLGDVADVRKAVAEVKRDAKHALARALDDAPVPHIDGQFAVIVIDPPWRYGKRAEDVTHRGRNQYPDMTLEQICALPVAARAADDCVLWLWTTNAFMREAYQCLDAWGFAAKTILTWAKDRMGTGDWLRGQTEHCLLAVRGKPVVTLTNQTTLLTAPLREHSRKPDEFYALVESLCHGPKLDMFAREARSGWVLWGAETEKF